MMRQAFDLVRVLPAGRQALRPRSHLGRPLGRQRLDGLDQARVQPPPPLQQQAAVGHLMGQGVLEGVFWLGKQAGLVQKLRRLEVRQAAVERCLGHVRNGPQQRAGHVRALHRGGLQQPLLRRR
jgi:hypothetical protein